MSSLREDQLFHILSRRICKCKKQLFKFSLNNMNASQAHLFSGRENRLCKELCVTLAKKEEKIWQGVCVGLFYVTC